MTFMLQDAQSKMQAYLENGLRLGWLIDPQTQAVEIYRQAQFVKTVPLSGMLSGNSALPGFELNLNEIF